MKAHTNTNSCGTVIFLKTLRLTTTALLPVIAKHYITVFKTWHDDLMKNRVKDFPATLATPKSGQCHIWRRNSRQHDKPSFWTCVDIWVSTDVKFWSVNLTFFKHGFNINQATQIIKHQRRGGNYNSKKWAINSLGDWAMTTHTLAQQWSFMSYKTQKMNRWILHHKSATHTHTH